VDGEASARDGPIAGSGPIASGIPVAMAPERGRAVGAAGFRARDPTSSAASIRP
jgi:hypothetical protein